MLQLAHGQSASITMVTDAELWKNRTIDQIRQRLAAVVSEPADSAVTMLLRTLITTTLLALLWRYFPQAIVALAICLDRPVALARWCAPGPVASSTAPRGPAPVAASTLRASADFMLRRITASTLCCSALQQDVVTPRAPAVIPASTNVELSPSSGWCCRRLTRQPTRAVGQALRPTP
jgi:hypothetical protein